ncbi:MAG: hypothetical protein L3J31_06045 [Bacteroidales bacterium]|nr:hypothetical protein [Bacteroidales bacterium]MCF6342350.1 hypothetical protein [Bacteroidales bacterium]
MKKPELMMVIFIAALFFGSACNKTEDPENKAGKLHLYFQHEIDSVPIEFDTLKYTNAAGNPYLVTEIQYFISDVVLYRNDKTQQLLDAGEDIHYVDTDLPETLTYKLTDDIVPGTFDSISFTFGINEVKNQSQLFVNPPESNMFWPELLGGGYHYMKLNGKWKDTGDTIRPFNFHMGIGQIYDTATGEITAYVQNYFRVSLPNSSFTISNAEELALTLVMDVNQWFEAPHNYDFNEWGGMIMQNQAAMQTARENGHNVFNLLKNNSK